MFIYFNLAPEEPGRHPVKELSITNLPAAALPRLQPKSEPKSQEKNSRKNRWTQLRGQAHSARCPVRRVRGVYRGRAIHVNLKGIVVLEFTY